MTDGENYSRQLVRKALALFEKTDEAKGLDLEKRFQMIRDCCEMRQIGVIADSDDDSDELLKLIDEIIEDADDLGFDVYDDDYWEGLLD